MKNIDCNICENKNIPLNNSIKIDSKVYCNACFEKNFSSEKELTGKLVERTVDPTICSFCDKDFGNIELKKISTYPICDECETKIKTKTFPTWVKGFFTGILVIVIIGFTWNWKYYQAYNNFKQSNDYFEKGNYSNASLLMNNASKLVPEVDDIKTLSNYFHGIELLLTDRCTEALTEFNKCKDRIPADYNLNNLIIQAKIGSSFDNKDYEGFLEASKENLSIDSTTAISLTSIASAYACIYADKGKEDAKQNSFFYLNKAKAIDDTSKEMKEYYNLVEYRIDSRKIIKREEFTKQFPNGWTKN